MIGLAINALWLLLGVIVLCLVVYLVLYGIKNIAGLAIPPRIEQGIWFIVLILVLIAGLSLLATGNIHGPMIGVR